MDSYEEMIIPEVPKVLPNEQLFIYVPTASNENLGVAKFDNEHFSVDQDGTVHSMSIVKAGNITISKSQWTDATPTIAQFSISPLENGQALIIMPADDITKQAAVEARLSMYPNPFSSIGEHVVEFIRAEADDAPNIDMNFNYLVFKIKSADIAPSIALIGVDAYGECGGSASGVDESAVREIITAMLGNVANERQYSADNPPPYPVTSVNGKTGAVSLSATDVVADSAGTAQTLVDDLARKTAQDLVNYYTKSQTLTKDEINALVSAIPKFKIEVVTSLPTSNISDTTVYLVKSGDDDSNLYTEYIRAGGKWEKLGTQTVDLTGYATEAWVNDILAAYVKTVDMETYVTGLLNAYQPAGDYLTPATGDQRYAKPSDIPTVPQTLPNPHALTIMGKTYNGSSAVSLTVDELIEAIKTASGGVVAWIGDDNNIYLSGNLTDGTYKAYYEVNGEYIEIGELTLGSVTPDPVTYTITWVNYDGTVLETDTVTEGDTPTYDGATPTRDADSQYTYAFTGWTPEVVAAVADAAYTAVYEQTASTPTGPTNLLAAAMDTDGSIYNGVGYLTGYRLGGGTNGAMSGYTVTGYMPAGDGTSFVIRTSNKYGVSSSAYSRVALYDASFTFITGAEIQLAASTLTNAGYTYETGDQGGFTMIDLTSWRKNYSNATYWRMSTASTCIDSSTVITLNEEIE